MKPVKKKRVRKLRPGIDDGQGSPTDPQAEANQVFAGLVQRTDGLFIWRIGYWVKTPHGDLLEYVLCESARAFKQDMRAMREMVETLGYASAIAKDQFEQFEQLKAERAAEVGLALPKGTL